MTRTNFIPDTIDGDIWECSLESQLHTIKEEQFSQEVPPPLARDYVEEFFQYRPPTLKRAPTGHTNSLGTRPPAEFDKHLHSDLILHHVVSLPSIPTDLCIIAENALHSRHMNGTIPPITEPFPEPSSRQIALDRSPLLRIRRETDIQEFYRMTTAEYCKVVGATLAFDLPQWTSGCLDWTLTEIQKKNTVKSKAVADGFLNMVTVSENGQNLPLSELHQEIAQNFPELAIWEFKNLLAGDRHTMEAMVGDYLSCTRFPWESCEFGKYCALKHESVGVTGCRMGFDANKSPCPCVQDIRNTTQSPCTSRPIPSCPDLKSFKQTPRHILQQVWAEAVRHDATFLVVQSGNFEIIGVRDRSNQTLYISDVIEVDNCEYGKLHTGLYIAAVRDAEDRTVRLKESIPPESWTRSFDTPMVDLSKMRVEDLPNIILEKACARDWAIITTAPKKQITIPVLSNSAYQRVQTLDSTSALPDPDSDTFFKIQIQAPIDDDSARGVVKIPGIRFGKAKKLVVDTVVLKAAHGKQAMEKLDHEYSVYLKLHKAGVNGIAKIIGFFRHANLEGEQPPPSYVILVMEDKGRSVHDFLKIVGSPFVSRPQLNAFQEILHKIHATGYLHGNLTTRNLMITGESDSVEVAIIGFGNAAYHVEGDVAEPTSGNGAVALPWPNLRAMKEYAMLQRILPDLLKRQLETDLEVLESEKAETDLVTEGPARLATTRDLLGPPQKLRRLHTY